MKRLLIIAAICAAGVAARAHAATTTTFDTRGHAHAVVIGRVGHHYLDVDVDNGDCKVGPFVVDESPTRRLLELKAGEDFPPGCSKASAPAAPAAPK